MKREWSMLMFALAVCAFACSAHARPGDTPAQCEVRYGQSVSAPVDPVGNVRVHKTDRYVMRVEFAENKAEMVSFRRRVGEPMSASEIQRLLTSQAESTSWRSLSGTPGHTHWETEDGALVARYASVNNVLMVMTRSYSARKIAHRERRGAGISDQARP